MADQDTPAPLQAALRQPLMLGLFLPLQSGAWSPSTAPRGTDWSFDYNVRCTLMAEQLGFDLVFGLAQWMGKGGYGGEMAFRDKSTDPLLVTSGLAALTSRILLISTVHILYGWHPLHLAKFGATIDAMSGGRWGLNVVTGYKRSEFEMFGLEPIEHDLRYAMADEFTTLLKRLWRENEELTHEGRFWRLNKAYVAPKPAHGRCILVNATSSPAGIDYAVRHSDLITSPSPAGANLDKACAALPAHNAKIKQAARALGREARTIINPHVICRETEAEAWPSARPSCATRTRWRPTTSTPPFPAAIRSPGAALAARTGWSAATSTWSARPNRWSTASSGSSRPAATASR